MTNEPIMAATVPPRRIRGIEWARRDGNELVIRKDAPWPDACVMCGSRQGLRRWQRTFAWFPPYVVLLLFVFWPAALFLRETATLNLVICGECKSRWSRS